MSAFERLSGALAYQIANTLGWVPVPRTAS